MKPYRNSRGSRMLAALSLSAGIAVLSGCTEPITIPSGDGIAPTIHFARDTVITDSGSAPVAGRVADSTGVDVVTYSYAGGPEHEITVDRGTYVKFDAEIQVRDGFHPLRIFATDLEGNRSWADMVIGATSARLNATIADYVELDEARMGKYEFHVRGTAPGMVRLEYYADSGFGRVQRGEIPLGDDPERSFGVVMRPPTVGLQLVAYDSNGVFLRAYAPYHGYRTRLEISTPAAERFVPHPVDHVDLHLTGKAWPGDVMESVAVIDGDGDTTKLDIPADEAVNFEWSPQLNDDMTRVRVRLETRDGHVGIFSFPLVRVAPPEAPGSFASVTTFGTNTCAVTIEERIYCWGAGSSGNAPADFEPTLVPVPAFAEWPFVRLFGGSGHSCGLDPDGAAFCWGTNYWGEIGDGTTEPRALPTPVTGGLRFTYLMLNGGRTCGIAIDERAYCWGSTQNPFIRQYQPTPTEVPGGISFVDIMIGSGQTCGLSTVGELFCWAAWTEPSPQLLEVPANLVAVEFGNYPFQVCVLDDAGDVWCLLHYPPYGEDRRFVKIVSGLGLVSLTGACGLTGDGVTYCWGNGYLSSAGEWQWYMPLVPVETGVRFRSLDGFPARHMCGVTLAAAVYCWGNGEAGQLGNGTRYDLDAPVRVTDPTH